MEKIKQEDFDWCTNCQLVNMYNNLVDKYNHQVKRGFEYVSRIKMRDFKLPQRSTEKSAGYDFFCPERVEIPPYKIGDEPFVVKTGVKVKMEQDDILQLYNRSSQPKKKKLVIPNSVGIIDADFYNNKENEGEMSFTFYNLSNDVVVIEKGEKLGQGVFQKFLITDDDKATGKRTGGFGSTGK